MPQPPLWTHLSILYHMSNSKTVITALGADGLDPLLSTYYSRQRLLEST